MICSFRSLATLTAAMVVSLPRVAGAAPPPCGTVVSASIVISGTMSCSSPALIAGADGITIDLRNAQIKGTGTSQVPAIAVDVNGYNNVTILKGVIVNFRTGIRFSDATGGTIQGTIVQRSGTAILVESSSDVDINVVVIQTSTIAAIAIDQSSSVTVSKGSIKTGAGITVTDSPLTVLYNTTVLQCAGDGITISGASSESLITGSTVKQCTGNGIVVRSEEVDLYNDISNENLGSGIIAENPVADGGEIEIGLGSANSNRGDGIVSTGPVLYNYVTANYNWGHGINADDAALDAYTLGLIAPDRSVPLPNVAKGNKIPPQCVVPAGFVCVLQFTVTKP
jgi:Right handed beta helix region